MPDVPQYTATPEAIPKQYWGTTSAQYGQVGMGGEVERTTRDIALEAEIAYSRRQPTRRPYAVGGTKFTTFTIPRSPELKPAEKVFFDIKKPETIERAPAEADARNVQLSIQEYNQRLQNLRESPRGMFAGAEVKSLERRREAIISQLDTDERVQRTPTGYIVPGTPETAGSYELRSPEGKLVSVEFRPGFDARSEQFRMSIREDKPTTPYDIAGRIPSPKRVEMESTKLGQIALGAGKVLQDRISQYNIDVAKATTGVSPSPELEKRLTARRQQLVREITEIPGTRMRPGGGWVVPTTTERMGTFQLRDLQGGITPVEFEPSMLETERKLRQITMGKDYTPKIGGIFSYDKQRERIEKLLLGSAFKQVTTGTGSVEQIESRIKTFEENAASLDRPMNEFNEATRQYKEYYDTIRPPKDAWGKTTEDWGEIDTEGNIVVAGKAYTQEQVDKLNFLARQVQFTHEQVKPKIESLNVEARDIQARAERLGDAGRIYQKELEKITGRDILVAAAKYSKNVTENESVLRGVLGSAVVGAVELGVAPLARFVTGAGKVVVSDVKRGEFVKRFLKEGGPVLYPTKALGRSIYEPTATEKLYTRPWMVPKTPIGTILPQFAGGYYEFYPKAFDIQRAIGGVEAVALPVTYALSAGKAAAGAGLTVTKTISPGKALLKKVAITGALGLPSVASETVQLIKGQETLKGALADVTRTYAGIATFGATMEAASFAGQRAGMRSVQNAFKEGIREGNFFIYDKTKGVRSVDPGTINAREMARIVREGNMIVRTKAGNFQIRSTGGTENVAGQVYTRSGPVKFPVTSTKVKTELMRAWNKGNYRIGTVATDVKFDNLKQFESAVRRNPQVNFFYRTNYKPMESAMKARLSKVNVKNLQGVTEMSFDIRRVDALGRALGPWHKAGDVFTQEFGMAIQKIGKHTTRAGEKIEVYQKGSNTINLLTDSKGRHFLVQGRERGAIYTTDISEKASPVTRQTLYESKLDLGKSIRISPKQYQALKKTLDLQNVLSPSQMARLDTWYVRGRPVNSLSLRNMQSISEFELSKVLRKDKYYFFSRNPADLNTATLKGLKGGTRVASYDQAIKILRAEPNLAFVEVSPTAPVESVRGAYYLSKPVGSNYVYTSAGFPEARFTGWSATAPQMPRGQIVKQSQRVVDVFPDEWGTWKVDYVPQPGDLIRTTTPATLQVGRSGQLQLFSISGKPLGDVLYVSAIPLPPTGLGTWTGGTGAQISGTLPGTGSGVQPEYIMKTSGAPAAQITTGIPSGVPTAIPGVLTLPKSLIAPTTYPFGVGIPFARTETQQEAGTVSRQIPGLRTIPALEAETITKAEIKAEQELVTEPVVEQITKGGTITTGATGLITGTGAITETTTETVTETGTVPETTTTTVTTTVPPGISYGVPGLTAGGLGWWPRTGRDEWLKNMRRIYGYGMVFPVANWEVFFKRKFGYLGAPGLKRKVDIITPKYKDITDIGKFEKRVRELI